MPRQGAGDPFGLRLSALTTELSAGSTPSGCGESGLSADRFEARAFEVAGGGKASAPITCLWSLRPWMPFVGSPRSICARRRPGPRRWQVRRAVSRFLVRRSRGISASDTGSHRIRSTWRAPRVEWGPAHPNPVGCGARRGRPRPRRRSGSRLSSTRSRASSVMRNDAHKPSIASSARIESRRSSSRS